MRTIPESVREARRWDATRDRYAAAGLCDRCAAQIAYGHADGFNNVHPPCSACAEMVAMLPMAQLNGWRSFRRGESDRKTRPSTATGAGILPATA